MALKNFKQLKAAHKKFMELSTDDIADNLEKSSYKLFSYLQAFTPRDTGRAINGWIPVVDTNPSESVSAEGKSYYPPRPFSIIGKITFKSIVWISNNVPYIIGLDNGASQQAPYGFSSEAFLNTTIYINSQIEKLNRKKYHV